MEYLCFEFSELFFLLPSILLDLFLSFGLGVFYTLGSI
jgi:hypothetical protein